MKRASVLPFAVRCSPFAASKPATFDNTMKPIHGLIFLTLIAGCSESAGPGDRLTRAEAMALAAAVVQSADGAYTSGMAETGAIGADGADRLELVRTLDISAPCPLSGRSELGLTLSVVLDGAAESAAIDLDGTLTHVDCEFVSEGVRLTVSGDPNLSFEAHVSSLRGIASPFTVATAGALDWSTDDGRAGRCTIDIDAATDFVARSRQVSANVCGQRFSETVKW